MPAWLLADREELIAFAVKHGETEARARMDRVDATGEWSTCQLCGATLPPSHRNGAALFPLCLVVKRCQERDHERARPGT